MRERLEAGSSSWIWPPREESGWSKLPRTLTIILAIMGEKNLNFDSQVG